MLCLANSFGIHLKPHSTSKSYHLILTSTWTFHLNFHLTPPVDLAVHLVSSHDITCALKLFVCFWHDVAMAVLKMSDKRLTADPLVGTKELQRVLEEWLKGQGSQDVWKLLGLDSTRRVDWKVSPMASLLCAEAVTDLLTKLLMVCKNGVLPRKNLRDALEYTQKDYRRINWTGQDDSDFFDKVDTRLRVYASWVREFKLKDEAYTRFCRRISLKEKATVDSLLSLMEVDSTGDKASASTCLALVPYKPVTSERASASKEAPSVFKRILSRKMSSPIPLKNQMDSPFPVRPKVGSTAASASTRPMEDENVKPGCGFNLF